jgi:cyclophilin family peptidyl-prolyl cis-trans isomerase
MKKQAISIIVALIGLSIEAAAQAPPTTVPNARPTLKRDRTQRTLYPKIIQIEDERAGINELIELLTPPHGGARRRAIMALGRIGYAGAVPPLIDILNADRNAENRDPRMRALAAFALGEIENHYAASTLLSHLDPTIEKYPIVRARSAEALGKIASNQRSAASLGNYGVKSIADALARLLPAAEAPITEDAKLISSMALSALLRIKHPSSIDPIAAQLRSPDPDLRWQAANALARIREGINPAVPTLLPLLADTNALVRMSAARALGVAKSTQAIDGLIKLLADRDERVAASAINALGAIADARAVEPLVAMGNSLLPAYRSYDREKGGVPPQQNLLLLITTALGNIKDQRALPLLKAFRFADGRLGSSAEIEIAMAKFGEAPFFDIPANLKLSAMDWKAMAAHAEGLGQLGTERAKAILLDLLSGKTYGRPDARAVSPILTAMAAAKVEGLRDILLEQLKAEDVIVRTTAANLLGDAGDRSDAVAKALEEAYKAARNDRVNDARVAILEAANKLNRPMNVQALMENTRDPDYVVRLKAAEMLRQSEVELLATRLTVGKVETGHDRTFWKRMAEMSLSKKNPTAVIHTKKGEIRIELYAEEAPMTVENFMHLAKTGFYNGLSFMRVVPNFVIQGGDPRGDQNGGPGYQIRCEINLRQYGAGAVGMALSGKDTGGSQFFITHSPQPHLDGGYTVFGQVTDGMDVVSRIARDDRIERIEIIEPK